MGTTRLELYAERHNALALRLKALGHPARWSMVEHLLAQQGCVNADFVALTGLAQPTVTRHLAVLVGAGLVACDCGGGRAVYCIAPGAWRALEADLVPWVRQAAAFPTHCETDASCCTPS